MLHILTINIHKGFTILNKRFMLHHLRDAIISIHADIVFLQEVIGENTKKAKKHRDWPDKAQHEFIADIHWPEFIYGKNAVYAEGHHGNAILSKFPIIHSKKYDISTNRFEKRGFLYSIMEIPDYQSPLHCICVHLGLSSNSRKKQMRMLNAFIRQEINPNEPIVVAGDFNEWRKKINGNFDTSLKLFDAALESTGKTALTFPSILPVLPLDRIYIRGLKPINSKTYCDEVWSKLSDHAALVTEVEFDYTDGNN